MKRKDEQLKKLERLYRTGGVTRREFCKAWWHLE